MPQALPIFRRFVSNITSDPHSETRKQVRGTLSRFLAILKNAQKRESEASVPCEKNTILASTILITSSNNALSPDDPLLTQFTVELADCLDNRMTTQMAAGCARSLMRISSKSGLQAAVAARLLPRFVPFLANPAELEGTNESRGILSQTLVDFARGLPEQQKSAALALAVPTLLSRAAKEGEKTHAETAARLIDLAGADQSAFRTIVGRMDTEQRTFMEKIIRQGQGPKPISRTNTSEDREPTIALKMNFGS